MPLDFAVHIVLFIFSLFLSMKLLESKPRFKDKANGEHFE